MSFDYVDAKATADRLIAKFGAPAQLVKDNSGGGFDSDGNAIPDAPDTIINGICTPILRYKRAEIDGQNIQYDDGYVYFSTDGVPEIGMTLTLNNDVFRIVNTMPLTSVDGVVVYRKLQVRR